MGEWQPIETAPKDGNEFLMATRSYFGGVVQGRWSHSQNCFVDINDDKDCYIDVTHWMPLPEPPH